MKIKVIKKTVHYCWICEILLKFFKAKIDSTLQHYPSNNGVITHLLS